MARYSNEFKERAVARLVPPESGEITRVSREVGVSVATLERWLAAAARLEAVIATGGHGRGAAERLVPGAGSFPRGLAAVATKRDGGAVAAGGSAGESAGDAR